MWMEAPKHGRPEPADQAAEERHFLTRLQARQMSQCPPISLTRRRQVPDLIRITDRSPVLPPPQPEVHAPKHNDSGPGYPLNLSTNLLKTQMVTKAKAVRTQILPPESPAKKYRTENALVNSLLLPHKTGTNILPRRRKRVEKDPVVTLMF